MNSVIDNLGLDLYLNGLPYLVPIHPTLVHFTIGLFLLAFLFDVIGALYVFAKPLMGKLAPGRAVFFDLGWWNLVGSATFTFATVAFGFFEMFLAQPPAAEVSAWGLSASRTMLIHGVGGTIILFLLVLLAVWRGCQRYQWRVNQPRQVQIPYLFAAAVTAGMIVVQGEMGAHLSTDFGIHNTTVNGLRLQKERGEAVSIDQLPDPFNPPRQSNPTGAEP
ncbi:DUF2231 domain-containing protein [Candidatus Cyanaurora vandensis]|uniref:DUF2231 domain-containing protein n=1 Tax=Candidatus Cyanaurora vandensis TaxID=2714958 RepID=UPI0025808ED9|nr:DUF2231 domain-containing protein [Candidatus Cyanaurora vandensis]